MANPPDFSTKNLRNLITQNTQLQTEEVCSLYLNTPLKSPEFKLVSKVLDLQEGLDIEKFNFLFEEKFGILENFRSEPLVLETQKFQYFLREPLAKKVIGISLECR